MILKNISLLVVAGIILLACSRNTDQQQPLSDADSATLAVLENLFTLTDAEKIMGEPARLTQRIMKREGEVLTFQCACKGNGDIHKNVTIGAIGFLVEQYTDTVSAHNKYSFTKAANEDHEGVKVLEGLGDEAYFHTDARNFYFIMVRKNARVFVMKVNKITKSTSLDAFNETAKRITASL